MSVFFFSSPPHNHNLNHHNTCFTKLTCNPLSPNCCSAPYNCSNCCNTNCCSCGTSCLVLGWLAMASCAAFCASSAAFFFKAGRGWGEGKRSRGKSVICTAQTKYTNQVHESSTQTKYPTYLLLVVWLGWPVPRWGSSFPAVRRKRR